MAGYPTSSDLGTFLGVTSSTVEGWLLNGAISFVERYCGRVFVAQSATRTFPVYRHVTRRGKRLNFYADLAEVTSITNGDGVAVAASEYYSLVPDGRAFTNSAGALVSYPAYGVEMRSGAGKVFYDPDGLSDISVVGYWGFSKTDPPSAIFEAILEVGKIAYNQRSGGGAAVAAAQNVGVFMEALKLPERLEQTLGQFKRRAV